MTNAILNNKETQILNVINDGGACTFATVIAVVEQDMYKKGNPLRKSVITKRIEMPVLLNANYANAVNRQREREGKDADFTAKKNWHEKVYDSFNGSIVRSRSNPDSRYLSFIVNKEVSAPKPIWFVDGRNATDAEIAIIKEFRKSASNATNQDLEKEVIFRTVKIENIVELRSNKKVLQF
jgi:hypothetical protein